MTNKNRILEVLKGNKLTSKEISLETNINIDQIYVYLNRMLKNDTIKRTTDKKPYKYAITNSNELLDTLREMFETGALKVYGDKLTEKYKKALEEL